jgi:hypothetical protein
MHPFTISFPFNANLSTKTPPILFLNLKKFKEKRNFTNKRLSIGNKFNFLLFPNKRKLKRTNSNSIFQ